jgi:hypothetical protein
MDTTVREHMRRLEQKRDLLNTQIVEESDAEKRNRLQIDVRAVESALNTIGTL